MAEFRDFEAVHTIYIAPIWRKPRRIKSFKHAAEFVVKVLWLGRCVKASDRTVEFRYEQFKASESKKQRLHDLKCMARCKDKDSLPDEVQERRRHFFQVFRTKFRQLKLLEQMDSYNRKYCLEKPANDAICFGKIRHVEKNESNIRSPFSLGKANRKEEARSTTSTPSKLAHQKPKPKVATNATVITETTRTQISFSTERSESVLAVLSTSSAKSNKSEERPSMDGMQDPRFQSLIRSLTPIDC